MKKIAFSLCALVLFGQGISSILAGPATPPSSVLSSREPLALPVSDTLATVSPLEHGVSRSDLIQLLVRMGYFYAGFLCVLLAIEFGTDRPDDSTAR